MNNSFSKFINFGSVADSTKRKEIAEAIYQKVKVESFCELKFSNEETENFTDAINSTINNKTLRELGSKDKGLSEMITQEILDFINKTKREINTTNSPFDKESELLNTFIESGISSLPAQWKKAKPFLKANYAKSEIDWAFYENEYVKSFKQKSEERHPSLESIKEHFVGRWQSLLYAKQTKWELRIIDDARKQFTEDLYNRLEELKKLQELLEPFTNELGRLFDMSKGNWQKADFDILKRYANLLRQDTSLQELVSMLGKLRIAETEYEMEAFADISLKSEWKVDYASKSDLIGIKESDDISSLLPSETVLLSDPALELVFVKRFAEKRLVTFDYQGKVLSFKEEEFQSERLKRKEDKGPFMICVDTSGSMHGTPETVAKTFCFAILKIAIAESRKCYLISFSTQIKTLDLSDLKNSLEQIISFLSMSFNGGTDASPAINEALRQLEDKDYKKADVLMISDFVMPPWEEKVQNLIKLAKRNNTNFHSLVIGGSNNRQLTADFDHSWFYDTNNSGSMLTLVENLRKL